MRSRLIAIGLVLGVPLGLYFLVSRANTWRPQTLARLTGQVTQVAYSPDGAILAVVHGPRGQQAATYPSAFEATFWDAHSGAFLHSVAPCSGGYHVVVFSPDSTKALVIGFIPWADSQIVEIPTFKVIRTLWVDQLSYLSFWNNGTELTVVGESKMERWNVRTGRLSQTWHHELPTMYGLDIASDRDTFAGCLQVPGCNNCVDETTYWGVQIGRLRSAHITKVVDRQSDSMVIKFSPDGTTIANDRSGLGNAFDTVALWDVRSGRMRLKLTMPRGIHGISSLAFSPDGHILAGANSYEVRSPVVLWDVTTGKVLRTLSSTTGGVNDLAFSLDGHTLASGNVNGTVTLWRIR